MPKVNEKIYPPEELILFLEEDWRSSIQIKKKLQELGYDFSQMQIMRMLDNTNRLAFDDKTKKLKLITDNDF